MGPQRFQHSVSPGLQPPELAPLAAYCVRAGGFSTSVNLFVSFTGRMMLFPRRAWPWDKWDKEVAFASSIPVTTTWRDLEQGRREVRRDGPVMLPPSFAVPRQFSSQLSKWEHHVTRPGHHNPIWDGNFAHVLHLRDATQWRCAEECGTRAKEAGELWEGLWFGRSQRGAAGVTLGLGCWRCVHRFFLHLS